MSSDQAEGKLLLLEKLDKEGSRYVQKVGRLLGGKLGILRDYRDGSTGGHILKDGLKESNRSGRQFNCLFLSGIADAQSQWLPATRKWRKPLSGRARKFHVLF
jgi:hypothetical protein